MPADLRTMADAIRVLSMDAVEQANSGHPGMPMGMADVATVLWTRFLKYDASRPEWADRDRFVLSAGHGSMLLYSLLYLTGNADMTLDQLKQFRQLGGLTPGHPENFHTKGIETTTGPLGQGISTAVGMALGERMLVARYGEELLGHYTYVIVSDGEDTISDLDTTLEKVIRRLQIANCQVYVVKTKDFENFKRTGVRQGNANIRVLDAERRMQDIASQTGGWVYSPLDENELNVAFNNITAELADQYILSYYPESDTDKGGEFRTITVAVKRPAVNVRTRKGYYVPKRQ